MADIKMTGNMKVKTLRAEFKKAFGSTLRVYNGMKFADDDATGEIDVVECFAHSGRCSLIGRDLIALSVPIRACDGGFFGYTEDFHDSSGLHSIPFVGCIHTFSPDMRGFIHGYILAR